MTAAGIIAVTGWGCGKESLKSLAAALGPQAPITALSPADLLTDSQNVRKMRISGADAPESGFGLVDALSRLVAANNRPVVLLGWSLGALLALEAALRSPRLISALILIGATARFCRAPGYGAGMPVSLIEAMITRLAEHPAAMLEDFFRRVFLPAPVDDGELQNLRAAALEQDAAGLGHGLRHLLITDLRADIARITQPTLILHGREDRIIPAAAASQLHQGLPQSRLEIIANAGHALPLRQAGDLSERILAFLGR